MCSIFIYFGVACIGLLLGSYIAGMLDESSSRLARANRIKACPNCTRIQNIKDAAERRARAYEKNKFRYQQPHMSEGIRYEPSSKKVKRRHDPTAFKISEMTQSERPSQKDFFEMSFTKKDNTKNHTSPTLSTASKEATADVRETISPRSANSPMMASERQQQQLQRQQKMLPNLVASPSLLGSPLTNQILGRQSHTRHSSLDIGSSQFASAFVGSTRTRRFSGDLPLTVEESGDTVEKNARQPPPPPPIYDASSAASGYDYSEEESNSSDSEDSDSSDEPEFGLEYKYSRVKNTKYVFETLREALLNSMVIIAFGCMGFYFIEGLSFIDSKCLADSA